MLDDFKANHSQADMFKAIRGLATYSWSKLNGLNGNKANLSPAKLKLADIGLELSLAIRLD